jgi:hypothetical protein
MSKSKFAALILAVTFVGIPLSPTYGQFQPTTEDRAACDKDAWRLCYSSIPDKQAVMLCLKGKKEQLSARCRAQFEKRGG